MTPALDPAKAIRAAMLAARRAVPVGRIPRGKRLHLDDGGDAGGDGTGDGVGGVGDPGGPGSNGFGTTATGFGTGAAVGIGADGGVTGFGAPAGTSTSSNSVGVSAAAHGVNGSDSAFGHVGVSAADGAGTGNQGFGGVGNQGFGGVSGYGSASGVGGVGGVGGTGAGIGGVGGAATAGGSGSSAGSGGAAGVGGGGHGTGQSAALANVASALAYNNSPKTTMRATDGTTSLGQMFAIGGRGSGIGTNPADTHDLGLAAGMPAGVPGIAAPTSAVASLSPSQIASLNAALRGVSSGSGSAGGNGTSGSDSGVGNAGLGLSPAVVAALNAQFANLHNNSAAAAPSLGGQFGNIGFPAFGMNTSNQSVDSPPGQSSLAAGMLGNQSPFGNVGVSAEANAPTAAASNVQGVVSPAMAKAIANASAPSSAPATGGGASPTGGPGAGATGGWGSQPEVLVVGHGGHARGGVVTDDDPNWINTDLSKAQLYNPPIPPPRPSDQTAASVNKALRITRAAGGHTKALQKAMSDFARARELAVAHPAGLLTSDNWAHGTSLPASGPIGGMGQGLAVAEPAQSRPEPMLGQATKEGEDLWDVGQKGFNLFKGAESSPVKGNVNLIHPQASGAPAARGSVLDGLLSNIAKMESGGSKNPYEALGPVTGGDRAYGKYQVMGANVPSWTKETLGQAMTPQEFLANPDAQEAVARAKIGSYLEQYNNPQDAASMWFSGRPLAKARGLKDALGTSAEDYSARAAQGIGETPRPVAQAPIPQPPPQPQPQSNGGLHNDAAAGPMAAAPDNPNVALTPDDSTMTAKHGGLIDKALKVARKQRASGGISTGQDNALAQVQKAQNWFAGNHNTDSSDAQLASINQQIANAPSPEDFNSGWGSQGRMDQAASNLGDLVSTRDALLNQQSQPQSQSQTTSTPAVTPTSSVGPGTVGNSYQINGTQGSPLHSGQTYSNTLDEVLGTNSPTMQDVFGFNYPNVPPPQPNIYQSPGITGVSMASPSGSSSSDVTTLYGGLNSGAAPNLISPAPVNYPNSNLTYLPPIIGGTANNAPAGSVGAVPMAMPAARGGAIEKAMKVARAARGRTRT